MSSIALVGAIITGNAFFPAWRATPTEMVESSATPSLPNKWSGQLSYTGHYDVNLAPSLNVTSDVQGTLNLTGPTQAESPGVPADGAFVSLQATWSGTASWHLHESGVSSGCQYVRDETYSTGIGGVAPHAWSITFNAPSSAGAPYTYVLGESNGEGQRVTADGMIIYTPEPGTNVTACPQPDHYTVPESVSVPAVYLTNQYGVLPDSGVVAGQTSDTISGWTESTRWNIAPASTTGGPVAVPGGPYTTTRAKTTTLNASASHDTAAGVKISNYRWSWTPGANCGADTVLASDHETTVSPRLTITPLCDLNLTLVVTDTSGKTSSASTLLEVDRRTRNFQTTPVTYADHDGDDPRTPTDPPDVVQISAKYYSRGFTLGYCQCPSVAALGRCAAT